MGSSMGLRALSEMPTKKKIKNEQSSQILSAYSSELCTVVQVQKCNKILGIHMLPPRGKSRVRGILLRAGHLMKLRFIAIKPRNQRLKKNKCE
jgi:hypothetical protein